MANLNPSLIMPTVPSIFLPEKSPSSVYEYGYDAIADIRAPDGTIDAIVSASIAVKPSGAGELVVSAVNVQNTIISFWISGGVAGRTYIVKLLFTTISAQTYEIDLGLVVSALLAANPVPPPPAFGFGTPAVWP